MSLARLAASNAAGSIVTLCLRLSHSAWPAPVLRAMDAAPVTVTIGGSPVTFPSAWDTGGLSGPMPNSDDSGVATQGLDLDDSDGSLYALIESVRGLPEPVAITSYVVSISPTGVTAAEIALPISLAPVTPDQGKLTLNLTTNDVGNFRWPRLINTLANSPGLRGRK